MWTRDTYLGVTGGVDKDSIIIRSTGPEGGPHRIVLTAADAKQLRDDIDAEFKAVGQ